MAENNPASVEFWFDPICPWCWMTSRWLTEVSRVRGFTVAWHPFSLKILNEGRNMSDSHRHGHAKGLQALRVIEAARADHGDQVVGELYTELGERIHPGGNSDITQVITESLAALGLPAELISAADPDTSYEPGNDGLDKILRENTERALELVGNDVGIPIIAVDGVAFFGPVVTPAPTGEDALKLWDGIVMAASVPGFYEVKRTRTAPPQF